MGSLKTFSLSFIIIYVSCNINFDANKDLVYINIPKRHCYISGKLSLKIFFADRANNKTTKK